VNIITILIDSLNRDALGAYRPETRVKTPNIDRLAAKSTVFDNHFVGSLPCMPARRELMAGRKEFLWRPWGPMEVFDPQLPKLMGEAGYRTAVVTDHYHYWEEAANGYIEPFQSIQFVRGHEMDPWKTYDADEPLPAWVQRMAEYRGEHVTRQYFQNVRDFEGEQDYFPAKVFTGAADWLRDHAKGKNFFLHVESFDVHEPFDAPEPYASMYTDDASQRDRFNVWPPYQNYAGLRAYMERATEEELAFLRSQYDAKITQVDHWLGKLLDRIDELDLWKDTMVVLTTDHGHDLGQRGAFGKQYPHYDSHANIPLMIYHPEHAGKVTRQAGISQTVDLFATVLEAAGAPIPEGNRHSRSLLPALQAEDTGRDVALYGTFGQGVCLTDGRYTIFKSPGENTPLNVHSCFLARSFLVDNQTPERKDEMPRKPVAAGYFDDTVAYPMWRYPMPVDPRTEEDFLYDRQEDPGQSQNLWDARPEERERMLSLVRAAMREEGTPAEQFERLRLV
jgi:arylsulfatase A-like enzyme